uniref:TFIIS central domain-containing protein n=1 Tax=Ascaris lumbricoides TaxID=6252 RepID=A0A0M3HHC9_ASCLU
MTEAEVVQAESEKNDELKKIEEEEEEGEELIEVNSPC